MHPFHTEIVVMSDAYTVVIRTNVVTELLSHLGGDVVDHQLIDNGRCSYIQRDDATEKTTSM